MLRHFVSDLFRLGLSTWWPICGLVLLTSCASTGPSPPPPRVTILSDTPIGSYEPEVPANPVPVPGDLIPPPGTVAASAPAEEVLEVVNETESTRQALADAIDWTAAGLRFYEQGLGADAHTSLSDARIVLLEANLPEVMQERGLMAIHGALPDDLRHHDPEAVLAELDLAKQGAGNGEGADKAFIESEVRRILRGFGATAPSDAYLEVFLDEVDHYIDYYQGKQREFFERAFQRKHKYWPTIRRVFERQKIPVDLGYMALVESGFNPRARSHANARGLWQFIPGTGKRYQLRRVDDFYDVDKATEAASEYLLDLIGIFGSRSFLLAMASYNAGEGRIQRCLRGLDDPFGGRSFWEIRGCLARETREYVPRIMAAAVIGSDPKRFGFDVPTEAETLATYDIVPIPSPTRLSTLASRAGVTVADLRTANSDLASNATSTPVRNFPLYVPKGGGATTLVASLEATPPRSSPPPSRSSSSDSPPPGSPPSEFTGAPFEYEVRAGDTLGTIAQGFGVTVNNLKEWNPILRRRVLYKGDRLTIHPSSGSVVQVTYRVRSGDTLSEIATQHGVALRDLARWNRLSSPYRLKVGQQLSIHASAESAPSRLTYTVKKGNTLRSIADVFAVRYRDIMRWNDLSSSTLKVGQKLNIQPARALRVERYQVRRGDTVAKIARRFGVSVNDVLTANGLGARTVIRPGQRLMVYVR